MKILHTADWHLGRLLHEHSLIEDQRYVLDTLVSLLEADPHDVLIIAGDVYDRSIPSPESVELFGSFLGKLKRSCPGLEICILSGNHDSAARLGFGRELFRELSIHIASGPGDAEKPVLTGKPGTERCAVFLLPFIGGAEEIRRVAKTVEAAREEAVRDGALWTVLGAHLFVRGGAGSDSERVFLGNAEQVEAGLFSGFDYAALGHLHTFQKAGKNAWYSGSPLCYSFGESNQDKVFISAELSHNQNGKSITLNPIPVKPLHPLKSLSGTFSEFFEGKRSDADPGAYLELTLNGRELVENPLPLLRNRYPLIMSVRQEEAFAARYAEYAETIPRYVEGRSLAGDFDAFLLEVYGSADPGKSALFSGLLKEIEDQGEEHEAP
ncbi:MAG: exonuclease subunit SbcD [Spirochaetaceae bacterium]|jgi:exonuclease SbcD|nr:exonuclease subunit SbcD [Spirochaetaceae bacterium]